MSPEDSLDPEDWDQFRQLSHRMLDETLDFLETVRDRPAWRTVPEETKRELDEPVPWHGEKLEAVYETFRQHIQPYPTGNIHPSFFGWVMGTGTPTGMLADMLASGMNSHVAGCDQSSVLVERHVLKWLIELFGFPQSSTGILVSGGTMAKLYGLAVARNAKAGFDIRARGHHQGAGQLTIYGSQETHAWITKACELMGLGRSAFRALPVNDAYQIRTEDLRQAIRADKVAGDVPFCIVGNVGTVNTGAIDDLAALRQIADENDLWLHVDGAFGSLAALAQDSCEMVSSQSVADSIAFDLHKWGYMPYEVGCVLVRDPEAHRATFAANHSYLASTQRGISTNATEFADLGLQLSRGFRALKVWMSLKEMGVQRIGRLIQQNIDQAAYLGCCIETAAELELLAPVSLNIVCFRYAAGPTDLVGIDAINEEILLQIQESGIAVPSRTHLQGRFAIRVCITNHRTRKADLDQLVQSVIEFGNRLVLPNPNTLR